MTQAMEKAARWRQVERVAKARGVTVREFTRACAEAVARAYEADPRYSMGAGTYVLVFVPGKDPEK